MAEIHPVFQPEMCRALFDCGKTRTSRFQKLGSVGDWFSIIHPDTLEEREWEITHVAKERLGRIAIQMYKEEGFVSEEDFMRYWSKLHPRRNDPDQIVFTHVLKPHDGAGETQLKL